MAAGEKGERVTRLISSPNLRFYLTGASPCPYLPGRIERKVFTNLKSANALALNDALTHSGFRRSQNVAYRPACQDCAACVSARLPVNDFETSKRWRRVLKKNASVKRIPTEARATREQFRLLQRYLNSRHAGGGMAEMDFSDYVTMVQDTPVHTVLFEYREQPDKGETEGRLIACALTDVMADGLSMVYSFFDPDLESQSIGSFLILDHVHYARELEIDYVYLGYWVKGSPKMGYKALKVGDGMRTTPLRPAIRRRRPRKPQRIQPLER